MHPHPHHHHPPNAQLTAEERAARVHLKKLFREQQLRSKLEMRLYKAQSSSRGADDELALVVVEETRRALAELDHPHRHAHPLATTTTATTTTTLRCSRATTPTPYPCDYYYYLRDDPDPREKIAARYIEQIYQEMQKTWRESNEWDDTTTTTAAALHTRARKNRANPHYTPRHVKEIRLEESQKLLQSMSQGQPTLAEFHNLQALRGYARHKFMERAHLVRRSLVRLQRRVALLEPHHQPDSLGGGTTTTTGWEVDSDASSSSSSVYQTLLEQLWKVRSVCSVGCGPGGETVGVVAFLQSHHPASTTTTKDHQSEHNNNSERNCVLDRILFCDWALADWRPLLESVRECLVEQQRTVRQVDMATCDVRVSLWDSSAMGPAEHSTHGNDKLPGESTVAKSSADGGGGGCLLQALTFPAMASSNACLLPRHQLVVVSFLLSETRGQWHVFFDDLVDMAPEGTLFLLTDPTAWQLHLFRERYEFFDDQRKRRMEFGWLDSSMYRPELQVLPSRLNSAVLLGMVVSSHAKHDS